LNAEASGGVLASHHIVAHTTIVSKQKVLRLSVRSVVSNTTINPHPSFMEFRASYNYSQWLCCPWIGVVGVSILGFTIITLLNSLTFCLQTPAN